MKGYFSCPRCKGKKIEVCPLWQQVEPHPDDCSCVSGFIDCTMCNGTGVVEKNIQKTPVNE